MRGPCWANMFTSCKKHLFVEVSLCKPRATWNELGLYPCSEGECAWCGVVDCRLTWSHHLATFQKVMVTPAVCPRLFEISPRWHSRHWSEITLCQHRRQRRLVVHMQSANSHELSSTPPKLEWKCVSVGVDALAVVWWKERDLASTTVERTISVTVHTSRRCGFISITVLVFALTKFQKNDYGLR